MIDNVDTLLKIAIESAVNAGLFLSAQRDMSIQSEIGHDIKLKADKESERIILEMLQSTGINILSEEIGFIKNETKSSLCWIIDPLDGSLNYARHIPLYCVSIALWDGNKPVLGVIYDFVHGNLYKGIVGEKAFLNDEKISVSDITQRSKAIMATGFPVYSSFDTDALSNLVKHLQSYKKVRLFGSAAFSMMMVARGATEAYQENDIAWWDVAAGIAIVLAAGGYVEYEFTDEDKHLMRVFAYNSIKIKQS
jgi:myo-inositol-1(or 4)-monophosphatase